MSQIFTGSGLGTNGSSIDALGGYGPGGNSSLGQANESLYINASNGNLVLKQNDGFLADHNLGQSLIHSYNAQGKSNQSHWVFNVATRITDLTGTLNSKGSSVKRIDEAGHETLYRYDEKKHAYLAEDGSGAKLNFDGTNWHFKKGASKLEWVYNEQGQLQKKVNQDGLVVHYIYQDGLLSEIRDSSHQSIMFSYQNGQLTDISAISKGKTVHHLQYEYDESGRLHKVNQELGNGKKYVITYDYDGNSHRISDIRQSDGTHFHIEYDEAGRVKMTSDGESRSLRYDYFEGKTTVTNDKNETWTYSYDKQSHLTGVDGPKGLSIRYFYENNHLCRVVRGEQEWHFSYNEAGDCIKIIDNKGKITERSFDAAHRLLSETTYLNLDASGEGVNPVTSYNLYDDKGHLKFKIAANGVVTAFVYDDEGNLISKMTYLNATFDTRDFSNQNPPALSDLTDWAASHAEVDQTDYQYDSTGQLKKEIHRRSELNPDGSKKTADLEINYVYDAGGRLIEKSVPDKKGLSYTYYLYDDLGRLTRTIDNQGHEKTIAYDDAHQQIISTDANGLQTIEIFDKSGLLIARHRLDSADDYGTTRYRYDKAGHLIQQTDEQGRLKTYFYDEAGRKIASVSATGQVTEYRYDVYGNVIETRSYANLVHGLSWTADIPDFSQIKPTADSANDRFLKRFYDEHNQLKYEIDASGNLIAYGYDACDHLIEKKAYAIQIKGDVEHLSQVTPQDSNKDRITKYYYNEMAQLKAKVDAEGYVTEYRYDNRGLLTATVRHYEKAASGVSWEQIIPKQDVGDITQLAIYDEAGYKIAGIDASGYLTEYRYDERGNLSTQIAYARQVAIKYDETTLFSELRPEASANDHAISYRYDDLNRLIEEVTYHGLVTRYEYNETGLLICKTKTDSLHHQTRSTQTRYNSLGQVIAVLDARGAKKLEKEGLSEKEVEQIWQQHAIKYTYDLMGNVKTKSNQLDQKITYFYDEENRLQYSVNNDGEVKAFCYNAFNQVIEEVGYANKLMNFASLSQSELADRLPALKNEEHDSLIDYSYNLSGFIERRQRHRQSTEYQYNAFGELEQSRIKQDATHTSDTDYIYDRRGLLLHQIEDARGIQRDIHKEYDAFGRVSKDYDFENKLLNSYRYDKKGNLTIRNNALFGKTYYMYDAYSRMTDIFAGSTPMGIKDYLYDDLNNTVTISYLSAGLVKTTYNAFGDTLTIIDGNANQTVFEYNEKGELIHKSAGDGSLLHYEYDEAGQLCWTMDDAGHKVAYTYDACGRMLSKTSDPEGLSLTTQYQYDGLGQTLKVIDPAQRVKSYQYNAQGQLIREMIDPEGLCLLTEYEYDDAGNMILQRVVNADGNDRVTTYQYDALARVKEKIIDPNGLKLTTAYVYDHNNHLIKLTDAKGHSSHYLYDANGFCRYSISSSGAVIEHIYDALGNEVETIAYANKVNTEEDYSQSAIQSLLLASKQDQHSYRVFDEQGRVKLSINAMGYATRYTYDANGNVIKKVQYNKPVSLDDLKNKTVPEPNDNKNTRVTQYLYDAMNRLEYSLDSKGHVVKNSYDNAGNIIARRQYAMPLDLKTGGGIISKAYLEQYLIPDLTCDQQESYHYDRANRLQYTVNAGGYVREYQYDESGNVIAEITFAKPLTKDQNDISEAPSPCSNDRILRHVYDKAGRERYRVSGDGTVIERQFDDNGNVSKEIHHALKFSDLPISYQNLNNFYTSDTSSDRVTVFHYDNANRISDKINEAQNVEHYDYDENDNVLKKTDVAGRVWSYSYDKENQLITASSPEHLLSVYKEGKCVNERRQVVTQYEYDSFGNKRKVIHDFGFSNQTTEYEYDQLNQQIKTLTRNVAVDTSAKSRQSGRSEQLKDLSIEFVYDAFGNLIAQKDKAGHWTHHVYDDIGNRVYDLSADNHVIGYTYDAFGNLSSKTRYFEAATLPLENKQAYLPSEIKVDPSRYDRETQFEYDTLNQLLKKTDTAIRYYDPARRDYGIKEPTTCYQYNAFGELIYQAQNTTPDDWVETRYYYDTNARNTAKIDAEQYLTSYEYNVFGELKRETQYADRARQITADTYQKAADTSEDRSVEFVYDTLGHVSQKILKQVSYQSVSGTRVNHHSSDLITHYTYDALGNLTSITDARGQSSFNYYDASGNLIAKVGPEAGGRRRAVTYGIDALGNIILEKQWANGARSASIETYQLNSASQKDRTNQYLLDDNGQVKERIDANGSAIYYSYDENGQVTRSWRMVSDTNGVKHLVDTRYAYDSFGNQIDTMTFEPDSVHHQYARYNSFGELTETSYDNHFKLTYEYDSQGRVWRSNSEGYYQIYLYDLEGHLTQTVSSTNSFHTRENENGIDLSSDYYEEVLRFDSDFHILTTQRASNRYDKLGHLLEQVREKVETAGQDHQGQIQQAFQSQSVDRWGNALIYTAPCGTKTLYTYNAFNQVTSKTLPEAAVMDEQGKTSKRLLKTAYYYDELGQCIAMSDANNHTAIKVYDAYGQITQETDPLGHSRYRAYDVFGNMSKSWQGAHENETRYDWDANDKLLEMSHVMNQGTKSRRFVNDELGRRLSEENVTAFSGLVEKLEYAYDNRGNMIKKSDAGGKNTFYRYDEANHLTGMVDANGNEQSWLYDVETGRLSAHTDLSHKTTRYEYNSNGLLLKETSDYGKNQVYHYNADGSLRQFVDFAKEQKINYTYDIMGNVLSKESTQGGAVKTNWILETDYYSYDALGRITDVVRRNPDDVVNSDGNKLKNLMFSIHYDYDAVSNIRHIYTSVDFYHTGHEVVKDYYFTYDANNRMLINKGVLASGEIVITESQGSAMHYNANGSLSDAVKYEKGHEKTWLYSYDEMGRVKDISYYLDGNQNKNIRLQTLKYDDGGHVMEETSYNILNEVSQRTESSYENGLLKTQRGFDKPGRERSLVNFNYDVVGNLHDYVLEGTLYDLEGNKEQFKTSHTLSYIADDDYKQYEDRASTVARKKRTTGLSRHSYDVNGNLESVSDENGINTASYLNDSREGIRAKKQDSKDTSYLNIGGHAIADIQIDHYSDTQTLEVYTGFTPEGSAAKAVRSQGMWSGISKESSAGNVRQGTGIGGFLALGSDAVFQDAENVKANVPQNGYGSYTVHNGDNLKSIALQVYGDASLWYLIADANGLSNGDERAGSATGSLEKPATGVLQSGAQLAIPAVNDGQHFSSGTHKVYNPNKIIGDTSATTPVPPPPPPPPKKHHSFWKSLVIGVIAFAATIFTAGVAGSLASQGASMAMGMQEDINYNSALITGLATAATAGVGWEFKGASMARTMDSMSEKYLDNYFSIESASRAMLADGASQLGNMALEGGRFSWAELGGAGASGGLLGSRKVAQANGQIDRYDLTHGMVSSELSNLAGGGINALAMGNRFDAASILASNFGSSAFGAYHTYQYEKEVVELNELNELPEGYGVLETEYLFPESELRVADNNGDLRLSPKDISKILAAQDEIANLSLDKVDDGTDPNKVHVLVAFDGTWNDRDKMLDKTNPAILKDLFNEDLGHAIYEKGVGTDLETEYLGGGFGLGAENRVNDAYRELIEFINKTKQKNPNAKIILTIAGFSRGATEARYFANMVVDKGIPDLSSNVNGYYTKALETPRIADLVIFDTVVAMLPYTNVSRGMKLTIPKEVEHVLHITAADEQRRFFPLTSAIDPANPNDSRITEIELPGVHSDIGGGYHNTYSRIPLNMVYEYMSKLGIPMKSIGEYKAPSAFDTSLRLHDSRYTFDRIADGFDDIFRISHHRRIYSAYSKY